jgi:hypothetical protein
MRTDGWTDRHDEANSRFLRTHLVIRHYLNVTYLIVSILDDDITQYLLINSIHM